MWPWIANRFTVTFGAIILFTLVWNLYVSANDDGLLDGLVVDDAGAPVVGMSVRLSRKSVAAVEPVGETTTDAQGRFQFADHGLYALYVEVSGRDQAPPRLVQLWFRNQNRTLSEPLVAVMP